MASQPVCASCNQTWVNGSFLLLLRTPFITNVLCSSVKPKTPGSWRRTWTGGSVWSTPFCPATSRRHNSKTTATLSAPNPLSWFASATWTTSSDSAGSCWRGSPRACRRSPRRLGAGRQAQRRVLRPQLPSNPLGPPLWHHCDVQEKILSKNSNCRGSRKDLLNRNVFLFGRFYRKVWKPDFA